MDQLISIIMPAFNEGGHIYENISKTLEVIRETGETAEIIAVDDGSEDNTLAEIERAAQDFEQVVAARNPYNMGKGMALRTGFDRSAGDIIVFLDADLDLNPSQIDNLISELETGDCDVVVSSKHHPQSKLDYPLSRKLASFVYFMLIKFMFSLPVRDTQTGLKVFKRDVLKRVFHRLLVKKFAYDVELLATAVRLGYTIHEIPVVLDFKRNMKWGRIKAEDVAHILVDTLAIFYRLRIIKYYDRERPEIPTDGKPVLIIINGCPPSEEIIDMLTIDDNVRVACIQNSDDLPSKVDYFTDMEQFSEWIRHHKDSYDVIGYLGDQVVPLGSWVNSAIRNFENSHVTAVCGPLLPGSPSSLREKAAGMLFSSFVSAGPDNYLYSFKPVQNVDKGLMQNVFIRASAMSHSALDTHGMAIDNGIIYMTSAQNGALLYDPDVAGSRPVPRLFTPYLRMAARDAFEKGRYFFTSPPAGSRWWMLLPLLIWTFFGAGWLYIPIETYRLIVSVYAGVVVLASLAHFDIICAPLFMIGMILEQIVRAVSFPVGFCVGLVMLVKQGKREE